ncbi:hypothetical protein JL720_10375 [Aureococcus anophagefferens]|nr:hypothetical protein JL720_10375 [Aureococcus anophagefferens]
MAARDATMHRLRLLQAACAPLGSPGEKPEAWLFVCGVDGKDNWGSAAALRWLVLGESGRGLLEERVRPFFVGNDVPLASDADREAVAEALEETVLLVTRSTVSLLYDAPAAATLLVCPGLREYVVDGAGGDVDAAEAAKAAGFVRLARDPTSGLRLCRTYVLGAGVVPVVSGDDDDDDDDDRETAAPRPRPAPHSVAEASRASRALHGAAPAALAAAATLTGLEAPLRDAVLAHLPPGAGESLVVATDATDCDGRPLVDAGELGKLGCLVYVRLTLSLGRLGAVAVGDTFLFPPPPGAAPGVPLLQGEGALLTGDRCAPYAQPFGACGGPDSRARRSAATARGRFALLGAPGSGVGDVAAALLRRGRESDGVAWVHAEGAVDAATLALDVDATAGRLAAAPPGRLLLSCCCLDGALAVAAAARAARAPRIGAVVQRRARRVAAPVAPGVVDACLGGFATGVVLVDSAAGLSSAAAEGELQRRLKLGGARARAGRGGALTTAAVADVIARCDDLDADAFAAPAMEAARGRLPGATARRAAFRAPRAAPEAGEAAVAVDVSNLPAEPRRAVRFVVVAAGPASTRTRSSTRLLASAEPAVPRAKRDRASLTDDDVAALDAAAATPGPLPPAGPSTIDRENAAIAA